LRSFADIAQLRAVEQLRGVATFSVNGGNEDNIFSQFISISAERGLWRSPDQQRVFVVILVSFDYCSEHAS